MDVSRAVLKRKSSPKYEDVAVEGQAAFVSVFVVVLAVPQIPIKENKAQRK